MAILTVRPAHWHATCVSMLLCTVALVHFSYVILPKNPDHLDLHHSLTHDQAIDSPPSHRRRVSGSRAIALSVHVQVAHQRAQFLHLTLEPSDGSQNLRLHLRLGVRPEARGVV